MNFVGITRQLEITQKSNNRDRIEGVRSVRLHFGRHASHDLIDVFSNRRITLCRLIWQSIRSVIDSFTKTGDYGMDNTEIIARMFLDGMPAFMLRFDNTFFLIRFQGDVAGFQIRGRGAK